MTNRPFQSDSTKIYDESCFQSAPGQFGQNRLLVTYGQQRRTFDTTTTAITGQPFQNFGCLEPNQQFNQNILTPIKQTFPNSVNYTFPSQDQSTSTQFGELGIDYNGLNQHFLQSNLDQYKQQNMYQNQMNQNQFQPLQFSNPIPPPPMNLTLQQQIALNELQKHALETLLLHETLKRNPFKLRFHFDTQTDTNDLWYGKSKDIHPIEELNVKESDKKVENPEGIYSEASNRKYLKIKPTDDKCDCDKECQNQPEINSVEVQCVTGKLDCNCACSCEKEVQTEKKVAFEKESNMKKIQNKKRKQIGYDNDDSDSSSTDDDMSLE